MNHQKIQRFDFRDYDSEEKLRIKSSENHAASHTADYMGGFKLDDQSTSLRLTNAEKLKRDEQRQGLEQQITANLSRAESYLQKLKGENEGQIANGSGTPNLMEITESIMKNPVDHRSGDRSSGTRQ